MCAKFKTVSEGKFINFLTLDETKRCCLSLNVFKYTHKDRGATGSDKWEEVPKLEHQANQPTKRTTRRRGVLTIKIYVLLVLDGWWFTTKEVGREMYEERSTNGAKAI